jgi:hypothetical protein
MAGGTAIARSASTIATRYGQRSSWQSAQGTRPPQYSEASARPRAKAAASAQISATVLVAGIVMAAM